MNSVEKSRYMYNHGIIEGSDVGRTLVNALVVALVVVVLMGCSAPSGTPVPVVSESSLSENIVTVAVDDGRISPTVSSSDPRRGGVFLYAGSNWIVPDPAFPDEGGSIELHLEVFSGLMRIGGDGENVVEPELAERFTVSPDGLTYEFTLRRDLKFSDGSPLTAAYFKWSWERVLSPRTDSPHARKTLGMIDGSDAVIAGKSKDLTGVEIVDDRTLRIGLSKPRSDFPVLLADPSASVLKRGNVERWRDEWSNWYPDESDVYETSEMPIGTGPFKIVELDPDPYELKVVLRRNDHYLGRPRIWTE